MNKEILENLTLTLDKIKTKEEKRKGLYKKSVEREIEKIYFEIWKLILKNITKKEKFDLDIVIEGLSLMLKIDNDEKKAFLLKKIDNCDILMEKLKQDGLNLTASTTNRLYRFYVTRSELENIKENKIKTK